MTNKIERMKGKNNTNGFDKNKWNCWRKKKWIALVHQELKDSWVEPATKNDIEVNYMSMISLWKEELSLLSTDHSKPILINILAKNLLDNRWFDIAERMLDRGIWRAKQTEEIRQTVKIESSKDIENKDLWELKDMINSLTK